MNNFRITDLTLQLADTSPWLLLLLKLTALLAVGWIGHALMARRNPRYRLFWWRGIVCAVAVVAGLSVASIGYSIDVEREAPSADLVETNAPLPQRTESKTAQPAGPANADRKKSADNVGSIRKPEVKGADVARLEFNVPRTPVSAPRPARRMKKPNGANQAIAVLPDREFGQAATESVGQWSIDWPTSLFAIWLAGVGFLLVRLAIGQWRVRRFTQQAIPADRQLQAECDRVAASLGIKRQINVLQHSRLASPVLLGVRRPRILLPTWMSDARSRDDLPAVLAHELSHVRSSDLFWQILLHGMTALLWFHPLAWYLRRVHLADCERKADVDSAAFLGETGSYIRTLARVALQVSTVVPQGGMAMARTAEVTRRLAFLKDAVISGPLRTRTLAAAGGIGLLLALGLGGMRFAIAEADGKEPAKEKPKAKDTFKKRRMTVRVVDGKGMPIANASVRVRIENKRKYHAVDKNGYVTFDLPVKQPRLFNLWVKSKNHVWVRATWWNLKNKGPQPIPPRFNFKLER